MLLRFWSREDAIGSASAHERTWLTEFLHSFPHFDAQFQAVDPDFAPSIQYGESLVVLSALPVVWLLFTLLIFLIFFCVRCCQACLRARDQEDDRAHLADKDGRPSESRTANCCVNFWLIFFLFFLVVAIGGGYYGNEETDNGIKDAVRSAQRTKKQLVDSMAGEVKVARAIGSDGAKTSGIHKSLNDLLTLLAGSESALGEENYKEIKRQIGYARKNVEKAEKDVAALGVKIPNVKRDQPDLDDHLDLMKFIEDYRWLGTVCFFTWTALVGLLLIGGLARSSKCCLFFFAAVGMITLVICWSVVGFYLGVAVGTADFCYNTTDNLERFGEYMVEPPSTLVEMVSCDKDKSPYLGEIQSALTLLSNAEGSVDKAEERMGPREARGRDKRWRALFAQVDGVRANVTTAAQRVLDLGADLDCARGRDNVDDGVHALCYKALFGMGLLLLSGTLMGLCLSVLVLLSSCAWRHMSSSSRFGSSSFDGDCEHDPFIPAHASASGASGFGPPGPHHYMSRRYGSQNNSPDLREGDGEDRDMPAISSRSVKRKSETRVESSPPKRKRSGGSGDAALRARFRLTDCRVRLSDARRAGEDDARLKINGRVSYSVWRSRRRADDARAARGVKKIKRKDFVDDLTSMNEDRSSSKVSPATKEGLRRSAAGDVPKSLLSRRSKPQRSKDSKEELVEISSTKRCVSRNLTTTEKTWRLPKKQFLEKNRKDKDAADDEASNRKSPRRRRHRNTKIKISRRGSYKDLSEEDDSDDAKDDDDDEYKDEDGRGESSDETSAFSNEARSSSDDERDDSATKRLNQKQARDLVKDIKKGRTRRRLPTRADQLFARWQLASTLSPPPFESTQERPAPIPTRDRRRLRVISLFDGISTALVALKSLGLDISKYVASEVDTDAIKCSKRNHPEIIQVGDVRGITEEKLVEWGPFDLLVGGSPCNDFSRANPRREGFTGKWGKLFFDYARILAICREKHEDANTSSPFYWLFENVIMDTEDRVTISYTLGCDPVSIDAMYVSPMRRQRLYWSNIPGIGDSLRPNPKLDRLHLQECLEPGRKARVKRIGCITTRWLSMQQGKFLQDPVIFNGKTDKLWSVEIERCFGFPDHYTDVGNLSADRRMGLLGMSWSIPAVRHLFQPLLLYFKSRD